MLRNTGCVLLALGCVRYSTRPSGRVASCPSYSHLRRQTRRRVNIAFLCQACVFARSCTKKYIPVGRNPFALNYSFLRRRVPEHCPMSFRFKGARGATATERSAATLCHFDRSSKSEAEKSIPIKKAPLGNGATAQSEALPLMSFRAKSRNLNL